MNQFTKILQVHLRNNTGLFLLLKSKHVFLFPDLNLYLLVPGDEVDLPVPGLVEHPLLVATLLAGGGDHGAVVAHLATLVLPVVTVTVVTSD